MPLGEEWKYTRPRYNERMVNEDIDETRPHPAGDETIPMPVNAEKENSPGDLGETMVTPIQPVPLAGEPAPPPMESSPDRSRLWRGLVLLSLVALLVIAGASAYGGYLSGIDQRTSLEATQVHREVAEQFELGVQDVNAGRYEVARQRFEYVIQLDPGYPGVTDQLALVLLQLNTTATPTVVPTPTLTPTVDLRGAEELFSQAQVLLADERWSEAIETLLKLRKNEPGYQTVEVDSMLYVALRNRGVQRILAEADLEGGTYDLALAERFGPLDVEAANMRTWADLYVTGASFWGLDWAQAVNFFGQLVPVAPNLRDRSNITATERYRLATIEYGNFLADEGEWCDALAQYEAALELGYDAELESTATSVARECEEADRSDDEEEEPSEEQPTEETPPPGDATATPEPQVTVTPAPTEPYPAPTP
jgi:tetratricopeptide (TPR) repeat protein